MPSRPAATPSPSPVSTIIFLIQQSAPRPWPWPGLFLGISIHNDANPFAALSQPSQQVYMGGYCFHLLLRGIYDHQPSCPVHPHGAPFHRLRKGPAPVAVDHMAVSNKLLLHGGRFLRCAEPGEPEPAGLCVSRAADCGQSHFHLLPGIDTP